MYSLSINTNFYLQTIFLFNCLIFYNWEILCLQTHQGPRALMLFVLHILRHDRDLCCMSSGLTKFGSFSFLFNYYYYFFFFFPSFWDFKPCWYFLTSWIRFSFVKAHGLSLLFMEQSFLSNFGPQQPFTPCRTELKRKKEWVIFKASY